MQAPTRQRDVWWDIGVHMPFMYEVMGVQLDQEPHPFDAGAYSRTTLPVTGPWIGSCKTHVALRPINQSNANPHRWHG